MHMPGRSKGPPASGWRPLCTHRASSGALLRFRAALPRKDFVTFRDATRLLPLAPPRLPLLFEDPTSLRLLREIERLARSDATMLVMGEAGTGKNLIARHIHAASGRRGPFVTFHCGASADGSAEDALFSRDGSTRSARLEAAQEGTLFLDEIGYLPMPQQALLMQALQEGPPAVPGPRLVVASSIDLRQAVASQQFRPDLYHRLNVVPVSLAPLRLRPGDILPLAEHFAAALGLRLGCAPAQINPAAQRALLDYPWPGNVRELQVIVHHAAMVCRDAVIRPRDLRLFQLTHGEPAEPDSPPPSIETASPIERVERMFQELLHHPPDALHARVEATLLRTAYAHHGRNQVITARALGLSRHSLRTLLRRHGLLADAEASASAPDGIAKGVDLGR